MEVNFKFLQKKWNDKSNKDASFCKKWKSFLAMWKAMFDYQQHIMSGKSSYFDLTSLERRAIGYVSNFDEELYELMLFWLLERENIQPKDVSLYHVVQCPPKDISSQCERQRQVAFAKSSLISIDISTDISHD